MKIYKDKLAPHGAVVMHVSNRHLDLETVVVGIADANDLKSWVYNEIWARWRLYLLDRRRHFRPRGCRHRQARIVEIMGADRSRRQGAGLDRRLLQHFGRAVPAFAGRGVGFAPLMVSCPGRCAARSDALQSRGPSQLPGPGSAPRHFMPRRVRDTRPDLTAPPVSPRATQFPSRPRPVAANRACRR